MWATGLFVPPSEDLQQQQFRQLISSSIEASLQTDLPPWVRRMGFPVRVMATSDIDLCCSALRAIWEDDRRAVGREAILAESGVARRRICCSMGRRPSSVEWMMAVRPAWGVVPTRRAPTRRRQFPSSAGRMTLGPLSAFGDEPVDDISCPWSLLVRPLCN